MAGATVIVQSTQETVQIASSTPPTLQITSFQGLDSLSVVTKVVNYTLSYNDEVILGDCTSVALTFTLPTAVGHLGSIFFIKKIDSSPNAIILVTTSSQLIDGSSSRTIGLTNEAVTVVSNGINWYVV